MTWLDNYRARLNAISANAKVTNTKSIYDIANAVTAAAPRTPYVAWSGGTPGKSQWDDYNPFEKLLHSETLANVLGNPAVHNVIDTLSRPGYGIRNVWTDLANDPIEAFRKGFTGETEPTGVDVLAKIGVKDSQPDTNEAGDWIRALTGFGVDVVSDPLTYIPGAAVAPVGKGLLKALGLEGTKFVKNEAKVATELDPVGQASKELAATGKTTAPDNVAEQLIRNTDKQANATENIPAVTVPQWVQPALPHTRVPSTIGPERPPQVPGVPSLGSEAVSPGQGVLDFAMPKTFERGPLAPEENPWQSFEQHLANQGVKPAKEIVDDAKGGNTALLDESGAQAALTDAQKAGVVDSLKGYTSRDITRVLEKFKVTLPSGARKSEKLQEAQFDSFNSKNAITLTNGLIRNAVQILGPNFRTPKNAPRGIFNEVQRARRTAMYDTLMPMMKAADDTLRAKGIEPILGSGKSGLPLSLHDVLSSMPRHHVENYFMTNQKSIPMTAWLDIAKELVKYVRSGADDAAGAAAYKEVDNILAANIGRQGDKISNYNEFNSRMVANNPMGKTIADTEHYRLMRDLFNAAPAIAQKMETNSARYGIQYGRKVKQLELGTLKSFAEAVEATDGIGTDLLQIATDLPAIVETAVKASGEIPPVGAAEQALANLTEVAQKSLPLPEMEVQAAVGKATAKGNKIAAVKESLNSAEQEMGEIFDDLVPTADLNDLLELSNGIAQVRALFPHVANKDVRPILLGTESMTKTLAYKYHEQLGKISQAYTKDEISEAFYRVQTGHDQLVSNPRVKAATVELRNVIDMAFSSDTKIGKLARMGIDPRHINEKLGHFGVGDKYRFVGKNYDEAMGSWRSWENVDDPLALLSKTYAAGMGAYSEMLMGSRISKLFGEKTYKPGLVRITDSGGRSRVAKVIDPNLYYPDDIAKELRVLDNTLNELIKPASNNKVLRTFDAVTHMYKTQLTIYRPGHHLRNTYGDTWLGMMDGMFSPKWYEKGLKVMSARGGAYADWDPESLAKITATAAGKPVTKFTWRKPNGTTETVELNAEEAFRLGYAHGIYPTYQILEDLGMATNTGFDFTRSGISGGLRHINPMHYAEKLTNGGVKAGQVHKAAGKLSEVRDHYHRSAHFTYALENNPTVVANSFEEALDKVGVAASMRVRKWHPDGSDYSRFEQQVMRRGVLFYSWMRKAIPLVVEAHVITPGRALLYPKAMYALAEANGIDLENGFGDPFPLDQLFPSWMENTSQGPVLGNADSGYFGMKTGVPSADILDGYFNVDNPGAIKSTLMGNLNPALKAPIEIGTAPKGAFAQDVRLGGAPVPTFADYITKQLPNSSLVENLTDRSLPGTSADPKSNQGYEPQLNVGGITLDSNAIAGLNWLSGLGISDMSKPSYQNSARKEKQQAKAQFVKDNR